MKILCIFIALVVSIFQYQLWLGGDSVRALNILEDELHTQEKINFELEERNRLLEIEIVDLKTGLEAVEERARSELGMIKEGETFYLLVN